MKLAILRHKFQSPRTVPFSQVRSGANIHARTHTTNAAATAETMANRQGSASNQSSMELNHCTGRTLSAASETLRRGPTPPNIPWGRVGRHTRWKQGPTSLCSRSVTTRKAS